MWNMLAKLFLEKYFLDCIYVLEQFFSFKMDSTKDVDVNLDTFNRLILSLTNSKVNFFYEQCCDFTESL